MEKTSRGRLIMIDGINGVGKDEQAVRLCARAEQAGLNLEQVYVLNANAAIAEIWKLVEEGNHVLGSKTAQALEFYVCHRECVDCVVMPLLEAGTNVLLNRGPQTTLVYNVISCGLADAHPELVTLCQKMLAELQPDLGLIMDLEPQIALSRVKGQAVSDQFQDEAEAYGQRRNDFLDVAKQQSWEVIDASGSIEAVNDIIWNRIEPVLRKS